MNRSKRIEVNKASQRIAELEEENKELREHKANLLRADKKKTEHIDELEEENRKLKEENNRLRNLKLNGKTVEEREKDFNGKVIVIDKEESDL